MIAILSLCLFADATKVRNADIELEGSLLRVTPYHSMTGLTTED